MKNKIFDRMIEDDENEIDMNIIHNPKLSSTRIERPRRVHAPSVPTIPPKITNDYYNKEIHFNNHDRTGNDKSINVQTNNSSKSQREHSDIIDKVLAGIPLTDNEIRRVIHRPK